MRSIVVPVTVALSTAALGSAALALSSAAADARPVVVELFTSEGCSSCPPADAYLTELSGHEDVLPLAFHVTYWNSLGWRDPYSFAGATERQASYASRLGGGSYTPEMVVDGKRGLVGSERGEVAGAISAARGRAEDSATVRAKRSGGDVVISIGAGHGSGRLLLIGYDPRAKRTSGVAKTADAPSSNPTSCVRCEASEPTPARHWRCRQRLARAPDPP